MKNIIKAITLELIQGSIIILSQVNGFRNQVESLVKSGIRSFAINTVNVVITKYVNSYLELAKSLHGTKLGIKIRI